MKTSKQVLINILVRTRFGDMARKSIRDYWEFISVVLLDNGWRIAQLKAIAVCFVLRN